MCRVGFLGQVGTKAAIQQAHTTMTDMLVAVAEFALHTLGHLASNGIISIIYRCNVHV